MSSSAQRLQLSRFGPREERESKRIRRWAEVGSSAEVGRRSKPKTRTAQIMTNTTQDDPPRTDPDDFGEERNASR